MNAMEAITECQKIMSESVEACARVRAKKYDEIPFVGLAIQIAAEVSIWTHASYRMELLKKQVKEAK